MIILDLSPVGPGFSGAPQILAYGACVQKNIETLEKGSCDKEFQALRKCFAKAVSRPRSGFLSGSSLSFELYRPEQGLR